MATLLSKKITKLKLLIGLSIWSLIILIIFKLHNSKTSIIEHLNLQSSINGGRILLQKNSAFNKYFLDIISTTTSTISTTSSISSSIINIGHSYDSSEILIDNRPPLDEDQVIKDVETRLPSLPIAYWNKNKNFLQQKSAQKNIKCAKYPSIYELEFNNIYWQTQHTTNGTFQLFGAYYDIRKKSKLGPAVRILGMINRIEPKIKTYCQFWFDGQKDPAIVKTFEYKYIWHKSWGNYKQGIYQPYLIACRLPKPFYGVVPSSVSIVEDKCATATNNLRVLYNRPDDDKKKNFAICVKGLDFLYDDMSTRLVEWIELLSILGADKIFFYQLQIHPNISKVLEYYERKGIVQVTPITLPGGQPNVPGFQHLYLQKKSFHKRQNEVIPYNDCFYKNIYRYNYIGLLDIDEVIMPLYYQNWLELMNNEVLPKAKKIRPSGYSSYNFRNVYFLDDHHKPEYGWYQDIPKYMHMLQHVYRAKNFTKPNEFVKCFHDPEHVVVLHNHFPLGCLGGPCKSYPVDIRVAQLQHYRADCVKRVKKLCKYYRDNSMKDTTIWRFKDELIWRTQNSLSDLGFISKKFSHHYYKISYSVSNSTSSSRNIDNKNYFENNHR
ncbi:uncharacterized protein LOC129618425 [Condylostylus longicornis]|uniref:uncharacterized protein LOC129618425 n=1 Tax=Condylostylus longicornis TaxID=2530218 RepID=UPI00244E5A75|nr:uncharacterized protein LOC129618425 [Condylostylus longicornis]